MVTMVKVVMILKAFLRWSHLRRSRRRSSRCAAAQQAAWRTRFRPVGRRRCPAAPHRRRPGPLGTRHRFVTDVRFRRRLRCASRREIVRDCARLREPALSRSVAGPPAFLCDTTPIATPTRHAPASHPFAARRRPSRLPQPAAADPRPRPKDRNLARRRPFPFHPAARDACARLARRQALQALCAHGGAAAAASRGPVERQGRPVRRATKSNAAASPPIGWAHGTHRMGTVWSRIRVSG